MYQSTPTIVDLEVDRRARECRDCGVYRSKRYNAWTGEHVGYTCLYCGSEADAVLPVAPLKMAATA